MGDVVNLKRWKKLRDKREAGLQAEANRVAHGRKGAEKKADRAERERREALLDGAKREDDTPA
jgi:hypothetical protein